MQLAAVVFFNVNRAACEAHVVESLYHAYLVNTEGRVGWLLLSIATGIHNPVVWGSSVVSIVC